MRLLFLGKLMLGWGTGCGARIAPSLGMWSISGTSAWHLHRAERKEGGSGGEQDLLCSTFKTKRFY